MYLSSISDVYILLLVFLPLRYVHESDECTASSYGATKASNVLEPGKGAWWAVSERTTSSSHWSEGGEHGGLQAKEQRDAKAVAPRQRGVSSSESDTPTSHPTGIAIVTAVKSGVHILARLHKICPCARNHDDTKVIGIP